MKKRNVRTSRSVVPLILLALSWVLNASVTPFANRLLRLGALSVLGVRGSVRLFRWLGLCLVVLLAWNLLWRSLLASSQVSCGICRFFRTSLASTGLAKVEDVPRSHLLHACESALAIYEVAPCGTSLVCWPNCSSRIRL